MSLLNSCLKSLMPSHAFEYTIAPFDSARNLGVIFDISLTMSDHISSVSKSCFLCIRDLRRIRNTNYCYLAHTFQGRLATLSFLIFLALNSIVFSWFLTLLLVLFLKLLDLPIFPMFLNLCIHWLKIDQRIHYKIILITYKNTPISQPLHLHNLLQVQSDSRFTRSSATVTLTRPTVSSRLKITDRSFTHNDLVYGRLPIIINSYVRNSVDKTTLDRVAFLRERIMIRDSSLTLSGLLSIVTS